MAISYSKAHIQKVLGIIEGATPRLFPPIKLGKRWVVRVDYLYHVGTGIFPTFVDKVVKWCKENCPSAHSYSSGDFTFDTEDDALLCYLRFS